MEGNSSSIIPYLFLITFILALGLGVWQFRRARKAKEEHHRSASAKVQGEAYNGGDAKRDGRGVTGADAPTRTASSAEVLRD